MRLLAYILAPLGVLAAAILLWWTVLPACAVVPLIGTAPWGHCPAAPVERRLAEEEAARTRALLAEIRMLERDLAALAQCPVPEPDPSEIAPDRWEARDLSLLEGCWELEGPYRMRNLETGADEQVENWRTCFGPDGTGSQSFGFPGGVTCEGPMSARFADGGTLSLDDTAAVPCSDGNPILRREGVCRLDDENRVQCSIGDDGNTPAEVRLRRVEGPAGTSGEDQ